MSEQKLDPQRDAFEQRSRALFEDSVEGLDMRTRSRLTRARFAALEAAARSDRGGWKLAMSWMPAVGVSAAAVLGVALWFGSPNKAVPEGSSFEDLEIVMSSDAGSADEIEMLQEDPEFYDWAASAVNPEPAA